MADDSLLHELVTNASLQTLAIINVAWLVGIRVLQFVLLRVANKPRASEIARVLGGLRFNLFLACVLATQILEHVQSLRNLGSFGDAALVTSLVILRLL